MAENLDSNEGNRQSTTAIEVCAISKIVDIVADHEAANSQLTILHDISFSIDFGSYFWGSAYVSFIIDFGLTYLSLYSYILP